jgi:hypothetical protein
VNFINFSKSSQKAYLFAVKGHFSYLYINETYDTYWNDILYKNEHVAIYEHFHLAQIYILTERLRSICTVILYRACQHKNKKFLFENVLKVYACTFQSIKSRNHEQIKIIKEKKSLQPLTHASMFYCKANVNKLSFFSCLLCFPR